MRDTTNVCQHCFGLVLYGKYHCATLNQNYYAIAHNVLTTAGGRTMSPSPLLDQVRAVAP
jgi:hypothetical protein